MEEVLKLCLSNLPLSTLIIVLVVVGILQNRHLQRDVTELKCDLKQHFRNHTEGRV